MSFPPKYSTPLGDSAADVIEIAVVDTFHRMAPLDTLIANSPLPLAPTYTVPSLSKMGDVSTVPRSWVVHTGTTVPAGGPSTSDRKVC